VLAGGGRCCIHRRSAANREHGIFDTRDWAATPGQAGCAWIAWVSLQQRVHTAGEAQHDTPAAWSSVRAAHAEPTDFDLGTHGRFLLGGGKGKYVAPSKSAWKVKGSPKRKTAEVFKQVRHPVSHVPRGPLWYICEVQRHLKLGFTCLHPAEAL
jgi:hypothetical protein